MFLRVAVGLAGYLPVAYIFIEDRNFSQRSDAIKVWGMLACVSCALVSTLPFLLMIANFWRCCIFIMRALELKEDQYKTIPKEKESKEQEIREEKTESRYEEPECKQVETISKHEDPECIHVETDSEHGESEETESTQQDIFDKKEHLKKIIDTFNCNTRAWSPMIAITFATESVVLISSGFAFSNLLLEYSQKEDKNPHEVYVDWRNFLMLYMFVCCVAYFLGICWMAEDTHRITKELGSKVR